MLGRRVPGAIRSWGSDGLLFFERLRKHMKVGIIVVCVAFAVGLLYFGGEALFSQTAAIPAVAEVNGVSISSLELDRAYASLASMAAQLGQPVTRAQEIPLRFTALQELVDQQLMLQAARRERIRVDNRRVEEEFNAIKEQLGDRFNTVLRQQGLNQATLRELIRQNLLIQEVRAQKSKVTLTEEEVRQAFAADHEEIEVRHILIDPHSELGGDWDQALAKAQEIKARLEAGEDFAALAQEYSDDEGTKDLGGSLGYIRRSDPLVEEFIDAAFALEVGGISEPVRSAYGYHIIQVTDRRMVEPEKPFEEVADEYRAQLEQRLGEEQFAAWLSGEREKAQVVIHDAALRAYQLGRAGRLDQAIAAYREAILDNPHDGYLYYRLALLLEQVGAYDEALQAYADAANIQATDPFLWFALGSAYQEQGLYEQAKEAYINASELSPSNMQLHQFLADAFREMGFEELASAEQAKVDEIQKQLVEEFIRQQEAIQKQRELERQIEEARRADPDEAGASQAAESGLEPAQDGASGDAQKNAGEPAEEPDQGE